MGYNEREAIRIRLEEMDQERRRLEQRSWDLDKQYNFYIERLRELDQNGLGSISDLSYEEMTKEPVVEQTKFEPPKKYNGDFKQYDFEALKKSLSNYKRKKPEEQEKPPIVDFGINPNDRRRRGKQYNLKEVAEIAEQILKEYSEPMPIHKLRDRLAEEGYRWKHFLPTLPNIMKHSHHIEKPYRGHIEYVETGERRTENSEAAIAAAELSTSKQESHDDDAVRFPLDEIPDSAISGAKK